MAGDSASTGDPEFALRTLSELRRELDAFERVQVRRALAAGRSFGEVARALGISRQAAHRRYRELAPAEPRASVRLLTTKATRRAVNAAHAETLATEGAVPGSRQVLLGILHTDGRAATALRSEGVTLERARACDGIESHAPAADATVLRRILRRAARLALSRGDRELCPEHLLLAAIADADDGASRTLAALGLSPAAIRTRLGH